MDLTDIYRIFHINTKECTIYSAPNGSFSKMTHNQKHKENFNKFREIKNNSMYPLRSCNKT